MTLLWGLYSLDPVLLNSSRARLQEELNAAGGTQVLSRLHQKVAQECETERLPKVWQRKVGVGRRLYGSRRQKHTSGYYTSTKINTGCLLRKKNVLAMCRFRDEQAR